MIYQSKRLRRSVIGIPGSNATMTEVRNSNPSGATERNRVSQSISGTFRRLITTSFNDG